MISESGTINDNPILNNDNEDSILQLNKKLMPNNSADRGFKNKVTVKLYGSGKQGING